MSPHCTTSRWVGTQHFAVTTGARAWRRFVWRHITLFSWKLDWKTVRYSAHNIYRKKIQLFQTTEKNDSDINVTAKHVSIFEQNNRLRFLSVWGVAQSPRQSWTLMSLTITPPGSFEISGYQPLNKAAPRPWRTGTSTTPRRKPNNSPITSCLSFSVLYCIWKL